MAGRSSANFIHYNKPSVCTNLSEFLEYVNMFPLDTKGSSFSIELFSTKIYNTGDSGPYFHFNFLSPKSVT